MTIEQIIEKVRATDNKFFDPDTMNWFGQNVDDFRVREHTDTATGKTGFIVYAPSFAVFGMMNRYMGTSQRLYNPDTNTLTDVPPEAAIETDAAATQAAWEAMCAIDQIWGQKPLVEVAR